MLLIFLQPGASGGSAPAPSKQNREVALLLPEPELKDLVLIKLLDWQSVGLQLEVEDYELQKIKCDYPLSLDNQKREMFRAWLRTCLSPNYHDLIEALEAVGERKAANELRNKYFTN